MSASGWADEVAGRWARVTQELQRRGAFPLAPPGRPLGRRTHKVPRETVQRDLDESRNQGNARHEGSAREEGEEVVARAAEQSLLNATRPPPRKRPPPDPERLADLLYARLLDALREESERTARAR